MIAQILATVSHFIIATISHLGYVGVSLLMAIESAAIPLPSEVIMPFAGFLVSAGRFNLWALGLAGAVGSTIGSLVTYYLGYFGGRKLIAKYEHIVLVSQEELDLTEKFFHRYRHTASFIGRLLPVIRTFISIPAGIARIPVVPFAINAFIGSFIWSYFLAYLGFKLGENWEHLAKYFHKFDAVILIVIVIGFGWWLRGFWHRKHRLDRI